MKLIHYTNEPVNECKNIVNQLLEIKKMIIEILMFMCCVGMPENYPPETPKGANGVEK